MHVGVALNLTEAAHAAANALRQLYAAAVPNEECYSVHGWSGHYGHCG